VHRRREAEVERQRASKEKFKPRVEELERELKRRSITVKWR